MITLGDFCIWPRRTIDVPEGLKNVVLTETYTAKTNSWHIYGPYFPDIELKPLSC
jgi:hypothetical protein